MKITPFSHHIFFYHEVSLTTSNSLRNSVYKYLLLKNCRISKSLVKKLKKKHIKNCYNMSLTAGHIEFGLGM